MNIQDSRTVINNFVKNIRLYWQVIFLISVLCYGFSFLYRMDNSPPVRDIKHFQLLNWGSFAIALFLAISILYIKRKYFRLRYFENFLENTRGENPDMDEQQLVRRLVRHIGSLMKRVWIMGGSLILLGVIYYWITLDAWNMHVYFVVGLYSLVINYPRRDLFMDIPYVIKEILKKPRKDGENRV